MRGRDIAGELGLNTAEKRDMARARERDLAGPREREYSQKA